MSEHYAGTTTTMARSHVVITDVDIPFGRLVGLILKVMLASIPAYIILFIIFAILSAMFSGLILGLMGLGGGGMR